MKINIWKKEVKFGLRKKYFVEELGFEPRTFRMRSGHSTTELHPRLIVKREQERDLSKRQKKEATIIC